MKRSLLGFILPLFFILTACTSSSEAIPSPEVRVTYGDLDISYLDNITYCEFSYTCDKGYCDVVIDSSLTAKLDITLQDNSSFSIEVPMNCIESGTDCIINWANSYDKVNYEEQFLTEVGSFQGLVLDLNKSSSVKDFIFNLLRLNYTTWTVVERKDSGVSYTPNYMPDSTNQELYTITYSLVCTDNVISSYEEVLRTSWNSTSEVYRFKKFS